LESERHQHHQAGEENKDFEIDDLESLQDAKINNELLENHFLKKE
jgi:hypothetical protein